MFLFRLRERLIIFKGIYSLDSLIHLLFAFGI
jgi:hypothetical protein